MNHRQTNAWW